MKRGPVMKQSEFIDLFAWPDVPIYELLKAAEDLEGDYESKQKCIGTALQLISEEISLESARKVIDQFKYRNLNEQ